MRQLWIILLVFLLFATVSAAFDRGDFTLDRVEADFGHGCQYYNVSNPAILDATLDKPVATFTEWGQHVTDGEWEYLDTWQEAKTRYLPVEELSCEDVTDKNGTWRECEYSEPVPEVYYVQRTGWKPMTEKFTFEKMKVTQVRYCADYDMIPSEDGWGVNIDMIPEFNGFKYPEYAWWNASWGTYAKLTLDTAWTNGTYLYDNKTFWDGLNCTASRSDLRILVNNATQVPIWNETADRIWFYGEANTAFDVYCNNTGASAVFDINTTFPHLGRDYNNCLEDWNEVVGKVTMTTQNSRCYMDMSNPAGSELGHYAVNVAPPYEVRITGRIMQNTSGDQMFLYTQDGSNSHAFGGMVVQNTNPNAIYSFTGGGYKLMLDPFRTDTDYVQVISQNSTTNSDHYIYYTNYTLIDDEQDEGVAAGSPTVLDKIGWTDGSGSAYNNEMNITSFVIRRIQASQVEPVVTVGSATPYVPPVITNVTACGNLNVAGMDYQLIQNITNLTDTCLTISAANVTLDCDGYSILGGGSGNGVYINNVANAEVANCTIDGFSDGILVGFAGADDAYLHNNTILNITDDGISTDNQNNTRIINNTIYDCGDSAIYMWGNLTYATIENNMLHSSDYGIHDGGSWEAQVDDNTIYDNSKAGYNLTDANSLDGEHNHFYNNTKDLYVYTSGSDTYFAIDLDYCVFDSAGGGLSDYSNISLSDGVWNNTNDSYSLTYATLPTTPPSDKADIGSWVNITAEDGTPTLANLVWHYTDSQITYVSEATLDMHKYNASGWTELTDTLNVGANTLTVTNLVSFSDVGPLGEPLLKVNGTLANSSETDVQTLYIDITSLAGNIDTYNLTVYYNNTLMLDVTNVPNVDADVSRTVSVTVPLVGSNLTNIPWNLSAEADVGGTPYNDTDAGNQTVELWYYFANYTFTPSAAYTVEARNNYTISLTRPSGSPENVSYSFTYDLENCTWIYANGSGINNTCGNTLIQDYWYLIASRPSHSSANGLIASDIWINVSYDLTFDATTESNSSKTLTGTWNASREYFVWIVEEDNGTIDGADNISTWLNVTFYYEANLSQTTADSVVSSYTVTFPDGSTKNFTVSYGGTLNNATIRGYPDFYTATISSTEVYSKTNFATRSRFMSSASTDLSVQQNASIYFLADSEATYGLMIVHDNGDPVVGSIVQVQKFYSNGSLYITVDERYTNSDGKAASYITPSDYYHFNVIDPTDGSIQYQSTSPEQFIIEDSVYTVTINIGDNTPIDLLTPYVSASCYGNVTTNAIIFNYLDGTGITDTIRFLAYRANSTTPVCDQNITASSGGHTCSLSAPENLSAYVYTCEVWHEASPWWLDLVDIIDLRSLTGVDGWVVVAIVIVVGLMAAAFHPAIGVGLAGVSLFAIDAMGIYALGYNVTLPIMTVGLVLAYLMARGN